MDEIPSKRREDFNREIFALAAPRRSANRNLTGRQRPRRNLNHPKDVARNFCLTLVWYTESLKVYENKIIDV
jgi:hypothetical protein